MNVSPLDRTGGFEFVDRVKGGSIPSPFIPSVEKGIKARRGRVTGMNARGGKSIIEAVVPRASVQKDAPGLKGLTGGKGSVVMRQQGYEEVPRNLVNAIVASSLFGKKDDED